MRYKVEFEYNYGGGRWAATGFVFNKVPVGVACSSLNLWKYLEQAIAVELTENEQCYSEQECMQHLDKNRWRARVTPLVNGLVPPRVSVVYLGKGVEK